VGGGLGYGAFALGMTTGILGYLSYALIGFATGFVAGRPFWRHETLFTPLVKGVFGALFCTGGFWAIGRWLGSVSVPSVDAMGLSGGALPSVTYATGGILAVVFAVIVEWDDGRPSSG